MRKQPAVVLIVGAWLLLGNAAGAQDTSIRPLIGGLVTGSGFSLGAAVRRTNLVNHVDGHVRGILSVKKYQLYEAGIDVPELGRWLSFGFSGRYRNYPQEDYWGLGPNTSQDQRTNYLLEDVDTTATLSTYPLRGFRTGVTAGYLKANMGPGRDEKVPSLPESLQSSPRMGHLGAYVEYRTLDDDADPRSGGKYRFEWTDYASRFNQYVVDLRRFIPIHDADRIALRMLTQFTQSSSWDRVPFFMLPIAGGVNTVRGFDQYRFRDRNALILNAEYRRPLNAFLDVVGFVDAGRVFARPKNLGLQYLHPSGGVGARIKFGKRMFFGVDFAISSEGKKLLLRSDQMF